GKQLQGLLELPNGAPSADTFERVFKWLKADSLQEILETYGKERHCCNVSIKQLASIPKVMR
ncbi:hypothetical protein EZS27_013101, partial [termite gut metagenome]